MMRKQNAYNRNVLMLLKGTLLNLVVHAKIVQTTKLQTIINRDAHKRYAPLETKFSQMLHVKNA